MSEEQADYQEEVQETQESSNENDKSYSPYVDLSTLPEDIRGPIEGRLSHLSKLMRNQETSYERKMNDWKQIAEEQSRKIEELTSVSGQIVDHLSHKSIESQETDLRDKMQAAFEAGDVSLYNKHQADFVSLQVQKELQKNKPQPKKQAPKPEEEYAESAISPEEEAYVDAWQKESVNGQTVRPWAFDTHPEYPAAYAELIAVFNSPRYQSMTIQQKMSEVDRRMGMQKPSMQSVMGGNLTGRNKGQRIVMSEQAKSLAVKTKFAGPKATDQEHIEKYRKQIEATNKKGQR